MTASFLLIFLAFAIICTLPVQAATEAEIDAAIASGIAWLAADQEADGSWPLYVEDTATTGLAVLKLEHYAYELGYASPFDPAYKYHGNVTAGLDYLFSKLLTVDIGLQDHTAGATGTVDDPDFRANGIGVYAHGHSYPFDTYDTGIMLAAISASGTPNRIVNVPVSVVHGWQYIDVAQDMVDWIAWAQADLGVGQGGWEYKATDNAEGKYPEDPNAVSSYGPDNSNSGYVVLGLGYATDFGCTVPQWVKTELDAYVSNIQDPVNGDADDGGSWYTAYSTAIGTNTLKTGNLIFEMALVGDTPITPRVVDALDYLATHWGDASGANLPPGWDGDPAQYQAMFCIMKGLEYMGINTFSSIDWYEDFSDVIVAQQYMVAGPDYGSWQSSSGRGNPTIITAWALLILERAARAPEAPVALFTESLHTAPAGTPITFDPSGSYDLDGTIVLYEWDWDTDGVYDASYTSPTVVSHTYMTPGTYSVTLRVTDDDGLTDTATDTKIILPDHIIPEVPLGTVMVSAAMIIALAAYVTMPKWRRFW